MVAVPAASQLAAVRAHCSMWKAPSWVLGRAICSWCFVSSSRRATARSCTAPFTTARSHAETSFCGRTNHLLISLERSTGARLGTDRELWSSGSFSAEVYPDLPISAGWGDLLFGRDVEREGQATDDGEKGSSRLLVQTIGCQVRSRKFLRQHLQKSANVDGVLILSGSHPAHNLASILGLTPSSLELLQTASEMKQMGQLPAKMALWAVENPLQNHATRLEQKIEAGASVILTQPPLLWDRFADWWSDASRMGLTERARVVVGVPMVTSVANLRFWLQLCAAADLPGAASLLQSFKAQAKDPASLREFCRGFNAELVSKVLELPGVGGLHIMPLTKAARHQVLELQEEGSIPKPVNPP